MKLSSQNVMGSPWVERKNFGDVNRKSAQTSLSEEAPGGSHRSVRHRTSRCSECRGSETLTHNGWGSGW